VNLARAYITYSLNLFPYVVGIVLLNTKGVHLEIALTKRTAYTYSIPNDGKH